MYKYEFDSDTGGILLCDTEEKLSKEPRPVFAEELNILGFNQRWHYDNQNDVPYLWAEASNYFYRGRKIAVVKGGSLYEKPALEFIEEDGLPAGETLLPVDLDAMSKKNFELMENLRQATIKRIFNYWRRYHKRLDCFHVAFSGGKDSIVLLDLVKQALPKSSFIVVFGDTRMEFPDTYKIVDVVETQCKNDGIAFYRAASKFLPEQSWQLFGPPSTTLRWCCSVHKAAPQTLKIRELLGKPNFVGADFVGVRAQESLKRSTYDIENVGMKQRGQLSHNAILEWSSAEIWLYIFMHSLPINDCYKKGNSRAGCLLCPLASHKKNFFNRNSYPDETQIYIDLIKSLIDEHRIIDYETYLSTNGWNSRKNGMDLVTPLDNYLEELHDGYISITVKNPVPNWKEWLKTSPPSFFFEIVEDSPQIVTVRVKDVYDKTPEMKIFKSVFHKVAACVGCGVCEANCRYGAISFKNGFRIDEKKCVHCLECHNVESGCFRYKSAMSPLNGGMNLQQSLNAFSNHAPKIDWIREFFSAPEDFMNENFLGKNQFDFFKRFLYDAEFVERKTKKSTAFTELIKKLGWNKPTAWGLILIKLVYNNPQIRWYVENMPIGKNFDRAVIETALSDIGVSKGNILSIVNAFKRLCEIPLGTELHFGTTTSDGKNLSTLTRTKARVDDERVVLYALYRYAEAADGWYQFSLTTLMNDNSNGVSPAKLFGLEGEEIRQFVNGLSANYPEFISATFTHDLEKISLNSEKTSQDVLDLFND